MASGSGDPQPGAAAAAAPPSFNVLPLEPRTLVVAVFQLGGSDYLCTEGLVSRQDGDDVSLLVPAMAANALDLQRQNALLSFDRERGRRARLGYTVGTPQTFGMTVRQAF